ncbi:hypothetical protein AGLY_007740 [Aphis glycines]|uniref:Uncharacterized protein n=1 Tax=Aphis glycines TaxID=307491 RepID=A0A6G0TMY0_APHGL|nr:hypothetical protein AGLY_007740 [Aphis glycines]
MVALTSSIFIPGNLPALFKPGPNKRGICLIRASLAKNASYRLANFFTNFLFLLSFFKASTSMNGTFFVTMLLVTKNAHLHLGPGDVLQFNGSGETLVLLWIVVLETNLQFDSLQKVFLVCLGLAQHFVDGLILSTTYCVCVLTFTVTKFNDKYLKRGHQKTTLEKICQIYLPKRHELWCICTSNFLILPSTKSQRCSGNLLLSPLRIMIIIYYEFLNYSILQQFFTNIEH